MNYRNVVFVGVTCFLMISFSNLYSQKNKIKTVEYFKTWFEEEQIDNINSEIRSLTFDEIGNLYQVVGEHLSDSIFEARWLGLSIVNRVVSVNSNERIGGLSISLLLKFIWDSDTRIQYSASESLVSVPDICFTESHKDSILLSLNTSKSSASTTNLIKLCGKLEISESIPLLEDISNNPVNPFINRWIALAALTRMGDEKSEQKMLDFIKKTGISLDAINMLYPYVTYSRSRKNVDYLISIIKNDNSECESTNPDVTTRIPCAYHLLKVVGPAIKGFNWEGPNGLEMLKPIDALEKSKKYLNSIKDNWEFVGE
ncbi:MAG TPA: hypothetical protein PLE67_12555 [Tenuifilaceae bacterium]|nr:hypothetical protein [Tenuifilaceae bacterium]HPQ35490.1 hypothetical protein [Tenuifilaceae bacterium]